MQLEQLVGQRVGLNDAVIISFIELGRNCCCFLHRVSVRHAFFIAIEIGRAVFVVVDLADGITIADRLSYVQSVEIELQQ